MLLDLVLPNNYNVPCLGPLVVPQDLFGESVWTALKGQFPDRVILEGAQVTLRGAVMVVTSPLNARVRFL